MMAGMADDDLIIVTCVATRQQFKLEKESVRLRGAVANPWEVLEGLMDGSIKYLSQEARDKGWAWMTELFEYQPWEIREYRAVRHYDDDVLMRHLRYFKKPADLDDPSMTDD